MFLAASAAVSGPAYAAQESAAQIQVAEAYKALSSGDPEMAIANYSLAIDSQSLAPTELADALLNRALAHQQLGHSSEAVADYGSALKQSNLTSAQRYTALYNRGLALQKAGDRTAAIDDFTGALYLQPDFAPAYLARGNALRESGQNLFALSDYDKALQHNHPDMARVHFAQALAFAALKRPADERKSLEQALAANPGFAPAKQRLAGVTPSTEQPKVADPLLTASSAPIGGSMTMKKPDLPKPVAPPAELASAEQDDAPIAETVTHASEAPAKPAEVAVAKPKKKYLDRILPDSETAAATSVRPVKAAAISEAAPEEEATTASIEPAAAAPEETGSEGAGEPASAMTGWAVQVASATSEEAAWSTFKKMQSSKKVLRGKTPTVIRADLGGKGIFYRVRFGGYDSQKEAQRACSKFKSGGVSCYVSRGNS